jgi:hypothetical protein
VLIVVVYKRHTVSIPTEANVSESFGLTDEEYEFLQDDINQAITEGNRKYGFGNSGSAFSMFNASSKPAVSFANCNIENFCSLPEVVFPIPRLSKTITV